MPKREIKQEFKQDKRFVSNLCLEQPNLLECKKRLKLKNDLRIKNYKKL
jgi:hypothetical protein